MTEIEIKKQIRFHEDEIHKLLQLLPKNNMIQNLSGIGKKEIANLQERKIQSEFKKQIDVDDKSHLFYNKTVVLTGEFPSFENRNIMAKMLQDVGANLNTSISKKTDFVIVGFKAGPKKMLLIEEFQIKTFSEHEFIKLF